MVVLLGQDRSTNECQIDGRTNETAFCKFKQLFEFQAASIVPRCGSLVNSPEVQVGHEGSFDHRAWPQAASVKTRCCYDFIADRPAADSNRPSTRRNGRPSPEDGAVQLLVRAGRGFCITIRELNDALLWFTIEGLPGKTVVQVWLWTFGSPEV
jgi:hypothetical protein